jgi:rhomboid family GlyGly-CTERM serine protease
VTGHRCSTGTLGGFMPPRVAPALAILLAVLHVGGVFEPLLLTRDGIAGGELWRLVTGHLVHSDGEHLAWNLATLLVLGCAHEVLSRTSPARFCLALAAAGAAVGTAVLLVTPLAAYCGLSGVLNTLFVLVLADVWRVTGSRLVMLAGAADLAKIVVEAAAGRALFTATAWPPVPEAHLVGFAVGLAMVFARSSAASPSTTARAARARSTG